MATLKSVIFIPRCFNKWNFYRNSIYVSHFNNFHTFKVVLNKNDPIKFTNSEAANIKFQGFKSSSSDLWYSNYVIIGSFTALWIYFFYIRDENDIDEALGASPDEQKGFGKLFHLQMQLKYCEQNHLPTQKIKEEIKRLKKELNIPVLD